MRKKMKNLKLNTWITAFAICVAILFVTKPVYAININSITSEEASAQEGDTGSKTQSLILSADKQTTKSIRLTWNKIEGAQGYTVYQYNANKKKWKSVTDVAKTSYVVNNLNQCTTYKFYVAAYVKEGFKKVYGVQSDPLTTTTIPGKPSPVKVTQAGIYIANYDFRLIILTTKRIKGATGYEFAYSSNKNKGYKTLKKKKFLGQIKARRGEVYYFKVRAYKKLGDTCYYGPYSNPTAERIRD